MKWDHNILNPNEWSRPISNLAGKQEVARRIAAEVKDGDTIGFGSGSTSFLAIHAIAARMEAEQIHCVAIPTSLEVEFACVALNIPVASLLITSPKWGFDGADEVDPNGDLIKGRGGAMFKEKLIADSSGKTFILIDRSKLVPRLGTNFPVPVEASPATVNFVAGCLRSLGATEIKLRLALKKDGPVITENGNVILDVRFGQIEPGLEREIKLVPGVLESGLFQNRRFETVVSST